MTTSLDQDPFANVRGKPQLQRLNVVLQAITEVINSGKAVEADAQPSPIEYMGTFLQAMERHETQPEAQLDCIIHLLSLTLPQVSPAILSKKSCLIGAMLVRLLEVHTESTATSRHLLQCISCVVKHVHSSQWQSKEALRMLQSLLVFSVDPRPKLRKDAQKGVQQVLKSAQLSPGGTLPKTVAEISRDFFVRELSECTPKDHQVALHMASVLGNILHLFQSKDCACILEALFILARAEKPMLMLTTLRCAERFLRSDEFRTDDNSAKFVEQMVSALTGLKPHPSNVDGMKAYYYAVLAGFERLHELAPEVCQDAVASFIGTLPDGLLNEDMQLRQACADCMRRLIEKCCDERMVKRAAAMASMPEAQRTPSPLERIVSTLRSLLGFRFKPAWFFVFRIFSSLFRVLGRTPGTSTFLGPVVADLGTLRDSDQLHEHIRKEADEAIGHAIRYLGAKCVLEILPLNLPTSDSNLAQRGVSLNKAILSTRLWILPLLKTWVECSTLSLFGQDLLLKAEDLLTQAETSSKAQKPIEAKTFYSIAEQIWQSFPAFCNFPSDIRSFRHIARSLSRYLTDSELARPHVLAGISGLIQKYQDVIQAEEEQSKEDGDKKVSQFPLTADGARECLKYVAPFAKNFLPMFFNLLGETPSEKRDTVARAISLYASIADRALVGKLVESVMGKLAEAVTEGSDSMTGENSNEKAHSLADIAETLIQYMNSERIRDVYATIKPMFVHQDGILQKKSYKILRAMCEHHGAFVSEHIADFLTEVTGAQQHCSSSAKRCRLKSLQGLISRVPDFNDEKILKEFIPVVLAEIMLSVKESNHKTQSVAYDLLIFLGNRMNNSTTSEPADDEARKASVPELFLMIFGAIAAPSPHMKSGAVLALSRLIFEFRETLPEDTVRETVSTVGLLLQDKSREVVQSVLGFIKTSVCAFPPNVLMPCLPSLVEGLCIWCDDAKNHFRTKIRIIFERMIRRFGIQTLQQLVPEKNHNLLRSLVKQNNKRIRQEQDRDKQRRDKSSRPAEGDQPEEEDAGMSESDEADSRPSARQSAVWLREAGDSAMDLLSENVSGQLATADPEKRSRRQRRKAEQIKGLTEDDEGRIVIEDIDDDDDNDMSDDSATDDMASLSLKSPQKKKKKGRPTLGKRRRGDDTGNERAAKRGKGAGGARRSGKNSGPGSEYKSKRAGGDMKRAGAPDPFAYVALQPKHLNRRQRSQAGRQFDGLVRAAKSGAKRGKRRKKK
eukprot:803438_1